MPPSSPHILIVGTGATALAAALSILKNPATPKHLRLTLVDKASNPGGRLSTRHYPASKVSLDTGARVLATHRRGALVIQGKERWVEQGRIRRVPGVDVKVPPFGPRGNVVDPSRARKCLYFESPEGWGGEKGWIAGLVKEIKKLGSQDESGDRIVEFKMDHPIAGQIPHSPDSLLPPPTSSSPLLNPDIILLTTPLPQLPPILHPSLHSHLPTTITYETIYSLLLPTITTKLLRSSGEKNPVPFTGATSHPTDRDHIIYRCPAGDGLTSIFTGHDLENPSEPKGLVVQALSSDLGFPEWTAGAAERKEEDSKIVYRFLELLVAAQVHGLEDETYKAIIKATLMPEDGENAAPQYQIKRWKYAQPKLIDGAENREEDFRVINLSKETGESQAKGVVVLAGDWVGKGVGDRLMGVDRAWTAGERSARAIVQMLNGESVGEEAVSSDGSE